VGALEAALAERVPRRDALERKARVLETAHALVADAYDAFRDRDQERLVDRVSEHATGLTDGRIGPVVAESDLQDARVRAHGRLVPLESPPLSYGEYHALLLGVRMGAADFLAGVGVVPPLLVDEPFAHLDRERVGAVWDLLSAIARDRQVVVTTQDARLLEDLRVTPDIRLGEPDRVEDQKRSSSSTRSAASGAWSPSKS
jgi:DNA repair exonuclease SbcCD ATPase subunit